MSPLKANTRLKDMGYFLWLCCVRGNIRYANTGRIKSTGITNIFFLSWLTINTLNNINDYKTIYMTTIFQCENPSCHCRFKMRSLWLSTVPEISWNFHVMLISDSYSTCCFENPNYVPSIISRWCWACITLFTRVSFD